MVQFDLVEEGYEGFNKFIPYYLFPETTYTVALTRAPQTDEDLGGLESVGAAPAPSQHRDHLRALRGRRTRRRRRDFVRAGRS